jgi:hypothetical protein
LVRGPWLRQQSEEANDSQQERSRRVEQRAVAAAGVGLVGQQRIGAGLGSTWTAVGHTRKIQKNWAYGTVAAVAGSGLDDQRPAVAIDEGVELGRGQPSRPRP